MTTIVFLSNMNTHQTTICVILAAILLAAIYAFIKTPPAERWASKEQPKEPGVDYAPMYTFNERLSLLLKHALWLAPLFLIIKFWLSPHLKKYITEAHCHSYGPVNGVHLVFYGLFVGYPLFFALLIFLFEGFNAIDAFKFSQYPLPNQKVFRLTKYKYGRSAKNHALLILSPIPILIALSIWGGFQAYKLTIKIPNCAVKEKIAAASSTTARPNSIYG